MVFPNPRKKFTQALLAGLVFPSLSETETENLKFILKRKFIATRSAVGTDVKKIRKVSERSKQFTCVDPYPYPGLGNEPLVCASR